MSRRVLGLASALACLALLVGCSGDDPDDSASPNGTSRPTTADELTSSTRLSSSSTTTEPPATDVDAVRPVLEALIDRYDAAVAAILADPRVAAEQDHPAVREYLSLFSSDSGFPEGALQFWSNEGRRGRFYRPGPRGQMHESTVQSVEAISPETAEFSVCTIISIEIVDASGTLVEVDGGVNGGEVVAVRIDGTWSLRDLTRTPPTGCPDPRETS